MTLEAAQVSPHPAKFCGHRHCGSGDIMVLFCHVVLQEHVTKGPSSNMARSPSKLVTILPSLVAICTESVDRMAVCHVISPDHVPRYQSGHVVM